MRRITAAARELGFDTVKAQDYTDEQVDAICSFIDEHPEYATGASVGIESVLADMREMGYGV